MNFLRAYIDRFNFVGGLAFIALGVFLWAINQFSIVRSYEEIRTVWSAPCKIVDGNQDRFELDCGVQQGQPTTIRASADRTTAVEALVRHKSLAATCKRTESSISGIIRDSCDFSVVD
jgi:hypothetical protein